MQTLKTILFFLFFMACSSLVMAQTWTGAAGNGDWSDAGNWSGGFPTSGTFLTIAAGGQSIFIPAGFDAEARRLDISGGSLEIQAGGSLTIGDPGGFNEGFIHNGTFVNNGQLTVFGSAGSEALEHQSGSFTNNGTITISDWTASNGTAFVIFANQTLDNYGAINVGPNVGKNGFETGSGALIHNHSSGEINILGCGASGIWGSIINDGTLCAEASNIAGIPHGGGTLTNNGTYNTSGCMATVATIVPTMGEWALIIFGLIVLSFGTVSVMRWQKEQQMQVAS